MCQAVIFDLDGVLVRSDRYHSAAWAKTCAAWGLPFDEVLAEQLRGVSRLDSARIVLSSSGAELPQEEMLRFAEEKNRAYLTALEDMTREDVLPGVTELLQLLQEKGIPFAVASSSRNARTILEKTNLLPYFQTVIDGAAIAHAKPHPEVFQKAADALGVPYAQCLVVEDAAAGVEAALRMGAQTAGIGVDLPGVMYRLKTPADLLPLFQDRLMPELCPSARPKAAQENVVVDGAWRVTVLTDRLFRVETDEWSDEATQAIWYRDFPKVDFTWEAEGEILRIKTKRLTLELNKRCFAESVIRFTDGKMTTLDGRDNLLGTRSTLDTNGSFLREDPSVNVYDRAHIPLEDGVCARGGAAVYDDSASLLLHADGQLTPRSGGTDRYVFAYGHAYLEAVRALYRLCGPAPVLPRWALGNWWCRYWPYTQQEYVDLMDNFADDRIPLSVAVIDMDWHYVDIEGQFQIREQGLDDEAHGGTDGWTGYTWNENLFPNHRELLKDLHQRGLHVALNLHPALGVRWYEKAYHAMALAMGMQPGERLAVPFQIGNPRFVNHYLKLLHHPLEDEGVDFWWIDWQQGKTSDISGLEPLWALNHYHYLDSVSRRGTGLILSRYAGVGSHRYPVGFSGDIHMDWEFLDYMPYFTATAANVGYGWWSHDIGGHHRGERDEELYLRWLQFGVFSPINRIHCCPAEVTSKEPWTLAELPRAAAEKWFRLRHRLIAYLHSASWRNTIEGQPLICPMYYLWPEENAAYEADRQYMFGELLTAPITRKAEELGIAAKEVWLPAGIWTDIFTNTRYTGSRWVTVYRDSAAMPVFAREGAFLPLEPETERIGETADALDVFVYAGSGDYTLFEGSEPERTQFHSRMRTPTRQQISISGGRARSYHLFFKNVRGGNCRLWIDGTETPVTLRHNRCLQALFSLDADRSAELVVEWQQEDLDALRREEILKAFIQVPQDNWYKEKQWESARLCRTTTQWETWIAALRLPETAKGMLREKLWANMLE